MTDEVADVQKFLRQTKERHANEIAFQTSMPWPRLRRVYHSRRLG